MNRTFGIIGKSLSHSFSPRYFKEKFIKEAITDVSYRTFPLNDLNELLPLLDKDNSIKGLNVTIPYKEKIIDYVDSVELIVKEVGAANVLKIDYIEGKRTISAYNTDVIGFEKMLLQYQCAKHSSALILGTGGAAKAVAYVLKRQSLPFRLVSRSEKENAISYQQITKELIRENTLIINCTPLGMYPDTATFPLIPYHYLNENHLLIDLVYNPAETVFMKKAKKQNATVENAYAMLCYQAEAAWDIWNGKVELD
ncbi:MAG TPA: shikimate dehydrogenase [Bacteroidales bacterium]|nr:shikimate dehydrogenase [Bacteroidales bacterium]HOR82514.1 shikimate dehydrogenase [Bacteroidales bacterium]HPJ91248.1 shikimate dehydrogenase [Bacteroidales bacterium]